MGRSQREKGKRGEREWRDHLEAYGVRGAKRTGWKQSDGAPVPDVEHGMFAAEVKRHKKFWPEKVFMALRQADNTAGIGYLAARGDNQPWLVAMYAQDFVELAKLYDAYMLAQMVSKDLGALRKELQRCQLVDTERDGFRAKSDELDIRVMLAVGDEVLVVVRVDGFDFEVSNWHKADWRELMKEVGGVGSGQTEE